MNHTPFPARWLALGSLALLASGCVSTGEPYYSDGPGYPTRPYPYPSDPVIIHSPGVQPVYPAYPAPDWRQSERERERWEREREARERERHDREARDRDRERREREARERDRRDRERPVRPNPGRCDYDRYNPKTGQCLPSSESMP